MPLYEYECADCGHLTEVLQRLSDPPLTECPKCGGSMKKLLSAPAFQFKGTGWYVTDYARKGQSEGESKTDKSAKGAGDKSSSGGGDGGTDSAKKSRPAGGSSSD